MYTLDYRQFTLSRINAFIRQIHLLSEIDFPYEDSAKALKIIHDHIDEQRNKVQSSILKDDALKSRCARATDQLFLFQRFLGYIAKSSDPSNSFEIYFTFRRLAESILGTNINLVISSEWEHYSPVHFNRPQELTNFVFIGLPFSESENTLVVPLAGHELGHSIWTSPSLGPSSYENKYRFLLQSFVQNNPPKNLDDKEISFVVDISLIKCSEYFCDFIGLGLFGPSYMFAFAYLIAPQIAKELTYSHPSPPNRASALIETAKEFGHEVPSNFEDLFKAQINTQQSDVERLKFSEQWSYDQTKLIRKDVFSLLDSKKVLWSKGDHLKHVREELNSMAPTSSAQSLGDILNVSWDIYFQDAWSNEIRREKKLHLLNELTSKSFEILEVTERLRNDSQS